MEKQLPPVYEIGSCDRTGGMYAAGSGTGGRKHFIRQRRRYIYQSRHLFGCAGSGCNPGGGQLLHGKHNHASVAGYADYEIKRPGKLGDCQLLL